MFAGREERRLLYKTYKQMQEKIQEQKAIDRMSDMMTNIVRYTPSQHPGQCLLEDQYPVGFSVVTSLDNWHTNVTFTWDGHNYTRQWISQGFNPLSPLYTI